jgi:hypothetical protein
MAAKRKGLQPSDRELFYSLQKASANKEMYRILRNLIRTAGHLTLRDLFSLTKDEAGALAVDALREAKTIGLFTLSNNKCCRDADAPTSAKCVPRPNKFCSLTKRSGVWLCTWISDEC